MIRTLAIYLGLLAGTAEACDLDLLGLAEFPEGAVTADDATAVYYWGSERYPHAVLGDALEPTALAFISDRARADGVEECIGARTVLWDDMVFEDLTPRLVDMTGDGHPEIITTRSHQNQGAQVAVYEYRDGALEVLAETPFIGTRFRWLAIIGAADLDNDGWIEIAYIDRPHLAKTLRVVEFRDGRLIEEASMTGLSNHKIGEDFITSGLRDCAGDMALIVPNADRSELMEIVLQFGKLYTRSAGPFSEEKLSELSACG
ncbi:MAG: VCBS repeat-containing protein [Pseudomonadota bacterium]